MTMTNSSTRAVRVASAAPRIPSAGAPRWPKISTQFRKTFVTNEATPLTTETSTSSMPRRVQTAVLLTAKIM